MTHEQTLAELTAKICEAVPEIKKHPSYKGEYEECTQCGVLFKFWMQFPCSRPITLEDVLRAYKYGFGANYYKEGDEIQFYYLGEPDGTLKWKLGKPLHEQSPECLSFLHSLLHGK